MEVIIECLVAVEGTLYCHEATLQWYTGIQISCIILFNVNKLPVHYQKPGTHKLNLLPLYIDNDITIKSHEQGETHST